LVVLQKIPQPDDFGIKVLIEGAGFDHFFRKIHGAGYPERCFFETFSLTMPRFSLPRTLSAWNTAGFGETFRLEVEQLDADLLPLQQGLSGTSSVADEPFKVILIRATDAGDCIRVKAGVFYAGMLGGCNCADDPTPLEAQPEYCELWFEIDKHSGETRVGLVPDE